MELSVKHSNRTLARKTKEQQGPMSYTQKIYEAVLENLGEALIIISGSGTIEHFTYAAEQLFLYDRSEVLG